MPSFLISGLATIAVFVALATLTHLQFGKAGIINFGVVGFTGLGMYSFGVATLTWGWPYYAALLFAVALTTLAALGLGLVILNLDGESQLVATLAFATIIYTLVVTEKELTQGVTGLGTVAYPFDFGTDTRLVFMLVLWVIALLVLFYAWRVHYQPFGRLLLSIKDNETLSQSLGKPTFRTKVIFFTVTGGAMGFVAALYASLSQFLVPQMIMAGLTFTVWIAIILGGTRHFFGGLVGVLITFGLFDIYIENYVDLPDWLGQDYPTVKLMVYGLLLILVIMFRPRGILGDPRRA